MIEGDMSLSVDKSVACLILKTRLKVLKFRI